MENSTQWILFNKQESSIWIQLYDVYIGGAPLVTLIILFKYHFKAKKTKVIVSDQLKIHLMLWTIAAFITFNFIGLVTMAVFGFLGWFLKKD